MDCCYDIFTWHIYLALGSKKICSGRRNTKDRDIKKMPIQKRKTALRARAILQRKKEI
jgi:hypothetical protein